MKRPVNRLESKTIEHAIDLPVVRYVDVPQDRPTVENLISIPQIHYTMVKQILPTQEYDIHIPQLHYTEIPIIGEIHIDQQKTVVDKIALKQEWEIIEECAPTRTHFLQLPVQGVGIYGTVISEGNKSLIPPEAQACPPQPKAECPAQTPCLQKECPKCPEQKPCNSTTPAVPASEPKIVYQTTEIHHVSFKKCCNCTAGAAVLPIPLPAETRSPAIVEPIVVQPAVVEATTVEPVKIVQAPVATTEAAAGGLAWWIIPLILLGLLLCVLMLCFILCAAKKKDEQKQVNQPIRQEKPQVLTALPPQENPKVVEEPERKFVIKRKLEEEDEAQVDAEIAAHLKSVALQKEQ